MNKKAFTLVELIIVVTIIVILGTIAFISFGNYPSQTRDSVRKADFQAIKKALELYKIENGEYPATEELTEEEKSKNQGKKFVGFIEGKIGKDLGKKLNFGKIPTDPLTGEYYSYSVSEDKQIYVIKLKLENGGEKIVGDIPINCKNLKEKNGFKGNGRYTVFHENIEPRQVYCHENYEETFQLGLIGGDMEKILGNNENNQKYATVYEGKFHGDRTTTKFSTEEKYSGERSLKVEGAGNIARSDFIYIDPTKSYKFSGNFKIVKKDKTNTRSSTILLGIQTYSLIDGKIKYITPNETKYIKGTETKLARNLNSSDKKIYFECDEKIYNAWKNSLGVSTVVAFDVDISGNYSDLPNKNTSKKIGKWLDPTYGNVSGFLDVEGGKNWGTNKEEIRTCVLNSHFNFGKTYPAGTYIRQHSDSSNNIRLSQYSTNQEKEWGELNLEGILNNESLRKFDNFAKIVIVANYNPRHINGIVDNYNENTITYMDNLKFEVID